VDQDYYGFSRLITLTINHGDVEVTLTGGDTIMSGYVGVSGIENNSWDATVSGSQNQSIN
jgi:dUTPase